MKFDELDRKMRVFEMAADICVLPEIFMAAQIDGRSFTRLTKEVHSFEAPFDPRFRDYMIATTEYLMQCGFNVIYGYTQSDEISLLFQCGINFNDLPNWQKRGIGLCWETFEKPGENPVTGEVISAQRRRIKVDMDLPMKDQYSDFINLLLRTCVLNDTASAV